MDHQLKNSRMLISLHAEKQCVDQDKNISPMEEPMDRRKIL